MTARKLVDRPARPLTDPQRRALAILAARGVMRPAQLARALWPDSSAWKERTRRRATPAGGALGATMPMLAGRLLSTLWRVGHVRRAERDPYGYEITSRGRRALALALGIEPEPEDGP